MRGEPASGAGRDSVTEGLAQLWRLSLADPRLADLTDDLEQRLRCTAGRAVDRQVGAVEAQAFPRPLLARGAWFTEDGYTQMDHVRHPLSGLLATLLAARPGAGGMTFAFLLFALVAAVNPCRLRLALPERRGAVLLGALIALAAVAAIALAGGALLDALDISPESFRLGAAVVLALEGARALVLARPGQEPELPGLGVALVPVAFPASPLARRRRPGRGRGR